MRPAPNHPDILRKFVVALVPIRVQPAREALQETLGVRWYSYSTMACFAQPLVRYSHNSQLAIVCRDNVKP